MEALGGHIEVQECFSYQRPTKCGPNAGFSLVFERMFGLFLESFSMICLIYHFVLKNMIFRKSLFYFSESIFEGQVPIWRVSGAVKMSKKCLGGVAKSDARKPMKIINKYETMQNADTHEVWYIPHGLMFSCFYNVNIYTKTRLNK